ncbi:MAG: DUF4198 domain-containing protein, partial [Candidatus Marinimicrobia bacterium]|nr:DUF4198 domain-containing protein [Candidatus Neomarinimicrobiota bacterium]
MILLSVLMLTAQLFGHGVSYQTLRTGYGVAVYYEDGNPLEFADVSIFRPGETEFEFQQGMTDENGAFMFKPDTSGVWVVRISDGLGHGKVIEVSVTDSKSIPFEKAP